MCEAIYPAGYRAWRRSIYAKASAFAKVGKHRNADIHRITAEAWQRAAIGVDRMEYR